MEGGDGQRASESGDDDGRREQQQSAVDEQAERGERLPSHRPRTAAAAAAAAGPDRAVAVRALAFVERHRLQRWAAN